MMNTFFTNKEIYKFTWEARGYISIIDCFTTNIKAQKIIQDTRIYRMTELDTCHYLLCAKIEFPPRWINKNIN
jgi:hypothetical protein